MSESSAYGSQELTEYEWQEGDRIKEMSAFEKRATVMAIAVAILSLCVASSACGVSGLTYYENNMKKGTIKVSVPSRYGVVSGTHHSNKSDKVLLSFSIYNDGNLFRTIHNCTLELTDENGKQWDLVAVGSFDQLKDLSFKEDGPLETNAHYSIVGSIPVNKNQSVPLNLVFFYLKDEGWTGDDSNGRFDLEVGRYRGRLVLTSLGEDQVFESPYFEFHLRHLPLDDDPRIVTYTNVEMAD